jgi:hypothetical protein
MGLEKMAVGVYLRYPRQPAYHWPQICQSFQEVINGVNSRPAAVMYDARAAFPNK